MSEQDLMTYFKFDEADRLANQTGHMTKKQKARFIAEDKNRKKWGRMVGIFMLGIAALGPVFMLYAWIKYSGNLSMTIVDLSVGGVWMLVWGLLGVYVLSRLSIRPEFNVAKAQGRARFIDVQSSYANNRVGVHQELQIGGKRFMANKGLVGALPEDDYVVYYLDRPAKKPSGITYPCAAEDILSVEVVEMEEPIILSEVTPEAKTEEEEADKPKEGEISPNV
jgi:hypothetical protein